MLKQVLEDKKNMLGVFRVSLLLEAIPTDATELPSYLLKQEGKSSGDGALKEPSPG